MYSLFAHSQDKNRLLKCDRPIEAYLYFKDYKKNLVTGEICSLAHGEIEKVLRGFTLGHYFQAPVVIHLFYESWRLFQELSTEKLRSDCPLMIYVLYSNAQEIKLEKPSTQKMSLRFLSGPEFTSYKRRFLKVQRHLQKGNCYQLNLTERFYYALSSDLSFEDLCHWIWREGRIAPFAHATWIESEKWAVISNSPECLFKKKISPSGLELYSMPIKGTQKIYLSNKETWEKLSQNKKDRGELDMITDLLRNDLSSLDQPLSRVLKRRAPLLVPHLMHQYSLITCPVRSGLSFWDIFSKIFPGGSITGAPKKRVMEYISNLETSDRGPYTGSTLLAWKNSCVANINIRTSVCDFEKKILTYGSGGGVTVMSNARREFEELQDKVVSFFGSSHNS